MRTRRPRQRRWRTVFGGGLIGLWLIAAGACRPDPDLPPAQALAKAWEEFEFYDYASAERLLRPLVHGRATGDMHAEALFALANCFEHRQPRTQANLDQARRYYALLITDHPDSTLAPWARLAQARMVDLGVERGDPDRARPLYRAVIDRHGGHDAAEEATLRLAQTLTNDADSARRRQGVDVLEAWLAAHPRSRLAGSMHQVVGHAYQFGLADDRRAVAHYVAAAELGVRNHSQLGDVCYRIAYLAQHKLKDYGLARRYYRKLIDEIFRDRRAYRAKVAIRQMDQQEKRRP